MKPEFDLTATAPGFVTVNNSAHPNSNPMEIVLHKSKINR